MDTVFLSFTFQPQDHDLVKNVENLIESHGLRAVNGEILGGGPLTPEIEKLIEGADALVAIATPRDPIAGTTRFSTHPYVRDELRHARSKQKPAIALRQIDVDLTGLGSEDEHIAYDPNNPIPAFVKLSRTLRKWIVDDGRLLKVKLDPDEPIGRLARRDDVTLEYRWVRNGRPGKWRIGAMSREPGATFAFITGQDDALIEIRVRHDTENWSSPAVPQWMRVELDKDG